MRSNEEVRTLSTRRDAAASAVFLCLFFHLLVVSIYLDFSTTNQFFNTKETTPEEIFSESLEHSFPKLQR